MYSQLHNPSAHCTVPGSSCRLLQLELPDPRPVWAALDAAGMRRFTGEMTLHLQPVLRVWFIGGEVYLAERETDPPLVDRLLGAGVLTPEQLDAGSLRGGGAVHLGRLFERVPTVDRDLVELTVELQTAGVLGEVADRIVPQVDLASHRHHPSGIQRWLTRPAVAVADVAPPSPAPMVAEDLRAAVRQAVAEIEAAARPLVTAGLSVEGLLAAAPAAGVAPSAPARSAVAAPSPAG